MIVSNPKSLPTNFAIKIATKCDLFVAPEDETGNEELWMDLREKLSDFQKLSLTTDYDGALVSYWDVKLTDKQREYLELIYRTTKDWILGQVVSSLLEKLESSNKWNNHIEAAQIIIDNILGDSKQKEESRNKLLVYFSNGDESGDNGLEKF